MPDEEYDAGRAFLTIVPSFRGVADSIDAEARRWGLSAGQQFGNAFNDAVRRATNNAPLGPSDSDSTRQGTQSAGKFADGFKAKVTAALRALPDVQINADSTDADRKLADLRAQLVALSNARVGVDIDEGAALAQIDRLKAELDELGARSPSVSVRMDTAEAAAQLAALRAEIDGVDRSAKDLGSTHASPNVSIDTGPALAAIGVIKTALLGLSAGAVITPLIGGVASLLGPLSAVGLGGAGVAAASLPGLDAVKNALSAQTAAQKATGEAAGQSASAQVSAANQVKSAELSLADTERRIANDRVSSAEAVKTAQQGVVTAQQQAAQQVAQADQQVTTAEQTLAGAQRASLAAQQALTDAREAASRSLQDMAFAATDAGLQLQQDQLAVVQAQQALDAVNANSASTDLQKQQAALALQEAQQALVEQQVTLQRATEDNNKAQAAGVDGSKQVVAAQNGVTTANKAVTDATTGLAAAQASAAQARVQAQQKVAQAEKSLADARRAQAQQEAQDASDLVRAQMAVEQAHIGAAGSMSSSTKAADALSGALAKLTPQEAALLASITKFKAAFTDFGHALEPDTLPLFTGGLSLLSDLLPKLEPLIRATAGGLADMEKSLSGAVNGPGFSKFLDTLTKLVGPALEDIGKIGGNLAGVFAHVVEAFAPLSGVVLGGLKTLTGELNKATQSPALGQFVKTLSDLGPIFVQTFGSVSGLVGKLLEALAPLAGPVLSVINNLAKALSGVVVAVGPSIAQLFKTVAPAVTALVNALGPALTGVIKTLAPVIGTLGTALSKGLVALTPALVPLAKLIGTVVTALEPLLPVIGKLIGALLPPLASMFTTIVKALAPFISQLADALTPLIPVLAGSLNQLVKALAPIWPLFGKLLTALIPLIPPLAELIVQVVNLAVDLLPLLIPLLKLWAAIVNDVLVPVLKFLIGVIADVVKAVKDVIDWFKSLGSTFTAVGNDISSAWSTALGAIKTAWTDVRDFLSKEWKAFAGVAGKLWDGITKAVATSWGAVKSAVSGVWTAVENVFTAGVNFVTQDILNPLISILDDVLHVFGVHIDQIPALHVKTSGSPSTENTGGGTSGGPVRHFALGGVLPGYSPGVDNINLPSFHFSGGEGILVPEATRALGGAPGIQAINSMFSNRVASPGHFSGGGTVPPTPEQILHNVANASTFGSVGSAIGGAIGSVIGSIKDAIRQGAADVAIAALKTAELPVKALLGTGGTPFANTLATGVFNKLNDAVYDFIRGNVKNPPPSGGGPIPTGAHLDLIRQALGLAHVADTAANEAAVNTIATYESGWNPNAINLTDSNAAAGHPSQGLMQTIPGTFEAYRLASLPDVITDPLANLVAGIRYAVSRYGSLTNVPGVVGVANGTGYVGYDNGGFIPPGISTVFNGTGRPEPVFTPDQLNKLMNGTGSGLGNVTVIAQFGDETVKAQAHTVIDDRLAVAEQRWRRNTAGGYIAQLAR